MSYGLFEALVERKQEEDRTRFIHTAMIVSSVINFGFCRPEKPVEVTDFIPGYEKEDKDISKLPPEEQAKLIMNTLSKKQVTHRG